MSQQPMDSTGGVQALAPAEPNTSPGTFGGKSSAAVRRCEKCMERVSRCLCTEVPDQPRSRVPTNTLLPGEEPDAAGGAEGGKKETPEKSAAGAMRQDQETPTGKGQIDATPMQQLVQNDNSEESPDVELTEEQKTEQLKQAKEALEAQKKKEEEDRQEELRQLSAKVNEKEDEFKSGLTEKECEQLAAMVASGDMPGAKKFMTSQLKKLKSVMKLHKKLQQRISGKATKEDKKQKEKKAKASSKKKKERDSSKKVAVTRGASASGTATANAVEELDAVLVATGAQLGDSATAPSPLEAAAEKKKQKKKDSKKKKNQDAAATPAAAPPVATATATASTQPIPLAAELANLGELAPNVRIPLRGGQDKRFQRDKYQLAKLLTSCATEN